MNNKIIFGLIALALVATGLFFLVTQELGPKPIDPKNVVKKTVNMSGMTCRSCEIAIEKVSKNTGVVTVKASSPDQTAVVEYDKTQTDIETIMKAIAKKGFTPVSYEDEEGLHDLNGSKQSEASHEMKCGAGKCGSGKCGSQ